MNVKEFFKLCEDHDWYYQYSDDNRYWTAGERSFKYLTSLTKDNLEFEKIFYDWYSYHFANNNKERKLLKPVIENYIKE